MRIISTTDGKYIGDAINENDKVIQFKDGFTIQVLSKKKVGEQIVLFNFNYTIVGMED